MKIGVDECDKYLETNIKKLDTVLESKKHLKRFKELLSTLENATTAEQFKKYIRFYIEVRRNRIKSKLSNIDNDAGSLRGSKEDLRMSLITGPNTSNYQKGSHPVMNQVTELAQFIEV